VKEKWVSGLCVGGFLTVFNSAHFAILFFSAPQFTAPRRAWLPLLITKPFRVSQHFPSPGGTGSAVSAWLCYSIGLFCLTMLVRELVHGMQGLLERHGYKSFPHPAEVDSPLGGVRLGFAFLPFCALKSVFSLSSSADMIKYEYE
jgi:hypothetical protein